MEGKISAEEYRRRRNSLIISRGDRTKKGNLNARVIREGDKLALRVNVPPEEGLSERWIYPEIFIPEKYLRRYGHLLDGKHPYTVVLKRRDDDRGHDVRIVIDVPEAEKPEPRRAMTLDVNAGHVDFAVAGKERVLAVGRINCHEVQHTSANRTNNLLHATANKIRNIAGHYKPKSCTASSTRRNSKQIAEPIGRSSESPTTSWARSSGTSVGRRSVPRLTRPS